MKRKHLIFTVMLAVSAMFFLPSCEILLQGLDSGTTTNNNNRGTTTDNSQKKNTNSGGSSSTSLGKR